MNNISSKTRPFLPVKLTAIAGIGLSVIAAAIMWKSEMKSAEISLEKRADNLAIALQSQIEEYLQVTRALGAFYDASNNVNRREFKEFSKPFFERYSSIRGMAWIQRVSRAERATFEETMREEGFSNFSIRDRDAQWNLSIAPERAEYFPITYGEPFERVYSQILGIDWGIEPTFMRSLSRARDMGIMVASERLILVDRATGIALYKPIYSRSLASQTISDRTQSFRGLVYTIYRLSDLIAEPLEGLNLQHLDFYIIDESASVDNRFLIAYNSRSRKLIELPKQPKQLDIDKNILCQKPINCTRLLNVADRKWSLLLVPTSEFEGMHGETVATLAIGLLLTSTLVIYLGMSIRRIEDLKKAMKQLQLTQAQLVQAEKMSSLGQLVAGVAHEINNPVCFIYGNLRHADEYLNSLLNLLQIYAEQYPNPTSQIQDLTEKIDFDYLKEDLPKMLSSMKIGAERIQKIVLSLRTFSRLDEADMKAVNIHEGIESTLTILQRRLNAVAGNYSIEVIKVYGNLPAVECYPGSLNQVFMDILANAIDAIAERISQSPNSEFLPILSICTEFVEEKSRVRIAIADNGIGMSQEVATQIYNPFFTTKPVGKGTGLGLAICYQVIVEQHRGILQCFSEPGKGTEFRIEIPIIQSLKAKS